MFFRFHLYSDSDFGNGAAVFNDSVTKIRRFLVLVTAILTAAGCLPAPQPASPSDELLWQQQLDAVRAGLSQELSIPPIPLNPERIEAIQKIADQVDVLIIQQTQLHPDTLKACLKSMTQLRQLKLDFPVDNAHLAALGNLPQLTVLNLPQGNFDNAGLASLSGMPRLELLRFRSPLVTDSGLRTVSELPALRFLHLIDVPITDAGLEFIKPLANLESFYLDGGMCSEQGLADLLTALPNLHFHWNDSHLPDDPLTDSPETR